MSNFSAGGGDSAVTPSTLAKKFDRTPPPRKQKMSPSRSVKKAVADGQRSATSAGSFPEMRESI